MNNKRLYTIAFASALIFMLLVLVVYICQPAATDNYEAQRIDWGHKAYEIIKQDQEFRNIAGDNPEQITGIIKEGEWACMYYRVGGEIYNVSVDFKNDSVQSIAVETDESRLRWLNSLNMTPIAVPLNSSSLR